MKRYSELLEQWEQEAYHAILIANGAARRRERRIPENEHGIPMYLF